jgi:hypothetical protein
MSPRASCGARSPEGTRRGSLTRSYGCITRTLAIRLCGCHLGAPRPGDTSTLSRCPTTRIGFRLLPSRSCELQYITLGSASSPAIASAIRWVACAAFFRRSYGRVLSSQRGWSRSGTSCGSGGAGGLIATIGPGAVIGMRSSWLGAVHHPARVSCFCSRSSLRSRSMRSSASER